MLADQGDRREQVGDDGGTPEAHLAPGQHIAHEGGGHHQNEDDDAEQPQQLARRLVGAVIEPAEDVQIDDDEEHRRPVHVQIADQPAVIHVAHDVLDGIEGHGGFRRVVHGQHDAGDDHHHQHEAGQRAEAPHVVQVARRRVLVQLVIEIAEHRQPMVDPADDRILEGGCLAGGAHGPAPNRYEPAWRW